MHIKQITLKTKTATTNTEGAPTTAIIGSILQAGVISSATVIMIGLLLLCVNADAFTALAAGTFPHTPAEIWAGLLILQPQAVIALGLLLLIATPVLRVIVSIFAFNMEHDRRYVVIAFLLLAILMTSFLLGKGEI